MFFQCIEHILIFVISKALRLCLTIKLMYSDIIRFSLSYKNNIWFRGTDLFDKILYIQIKQLKRNTKDTIIHMVKFKSNWKYEMKYKSYDDNINMLSFPFLSCFDTFSKL